MNMAKRIFVLMSIVVINLITQISFVKADVSVGFDIVGVSYTDDQKHDQIIITIDPYGIVERIKSYKVSLLDQDENIRVSGEYNDVEGVTKLRLRLPSSLPAGIYLISLTAYDEYEGEVAWNTYDFVHTSPVQATTKAPQTAVTLSYVNYAVLLTVGVVVGFIGGGYWMITTRRSKRDAEPRRVRPVQNVSDIQPGTIFISYSRKDWDKCVEPMLDRLEAEGLSVWVDQHLLQSGDDWMDKIGGALQACDAMILCVSPDALKSKFVKLEYRYFFTNNKRLYPLICRNAGTLPPELQVIQFYPYDRLTDLVAQLKAELVLPVIAVTQEDSEAPENP